MKKEIHPEYKKTTIKCVCGNEIETGSVEENITPIGRKPYKLINIPLYCVSKINEYLSKL